MSCGTPPAAGSADSCARACPRCPAWSFLLAHDLARKPVPTFRDHALLFERLVVVVSADIGRRVGPLRHRRTLQELRRVLRRLAIVARSARCFAGGALGRVAADLAL